MLNSLHGCGTTLLDTINQVMDYGKISESRNSISSKRIKNENTIRLSCKPVRGRRRKDPAFDISTATEEAIEAVFIGSSYIPVTAKYIEQLPSRTGYESAPLPKRKVRFVILDVAYEDDWMFSFPIGSWRRIVMNLFGNAVKYTESGCKSNISQSIDTVVINWIGFKDVLWQQHEPKMFSEIRTGQVPYQPHPETNICCLVFSLLKDVLLTWGFVIRCARFFAF